MTALLTEGYGELAGIVARTLAGRHALHRNETHNGGVLHCRFGERRTNMVSDSRLQHLNIKAGAAEASASVSASPPDPLKAVRSLKRWVQIGVYTAILGTEPFYYFVLHYSWPQLLSGLLVGLIIATSAIEWAFNQMFKLRKRSAYPILLLQELSQAPSVSGAVEQALPVVNHLLRVSASFAALWEGGARLRLLSASGMNDGAATSWLEHCEGETSRVLANGGLAPWTSPAASGVERLWAGETVTLVPVSAMTRTLGVLALIGTKRGSDTKDAELLQAVGTALGLSIENLRQREVVAANDKRFRALIENSSDGIVLVAPDGKFTYAAPSTERILGYSAEEMIGLSGPDLVHPDDRQEMLEALGTLRAEPGASVTSLRRFRHKDGSWKWIESTSTNLVHEPSVRAIVANYRDVSQRLRADEDLKQSEEQFRLIQESALDAIITMNSDGLITSWNPQAETIFGWNSDEAVGRSLVETIIPEQHRQAYQDDRQAFTETGEGRVLNRRTEGTALDRAGREFPVELAVVPLYRGDTVSFCAFIRDISERMKAEETIRHLAYHDLLTGLPNRVLFEERLRIALAQARRSRQKVAVMFLDLDRFKLVNDTVGHTGGDQLLQQVARELSETIREGDTVARVGGDEFTFLLPGIERADDASVAAERILRRVRQPRTVAGQEFRLTTSIGITVFPRDGNSAEALMRNADTAMYRAKERGRDNYQLFTPAMKASLQDMLALENDLSHALERDELLVLYQPVMEIASGTVVGGEALLRWQHPQRGLVMPDEFIPLAEETGLIVPIGEWVLRSACEQAMAWQDPRVGPIRVTVNVSARQMEQPGLVRAVSGALAEMGLPGHCLHLEITEGAVMRQVESVTSTLAELRAMGVGISVDDFGTGYSSLGYLKRFPIDTIKIDRSFVRDVVTDQNDAAIVTTVIAMARSLNLRVIAEGVETDAQLGFLHENECDEFQGFLLSRAVSPAEFEAVVRRARRRQKARLAPLKFA